MENPVTAEKIEKADSADMREDHVDNAPTERTFLKEAMGELRQEIQQYGSSGRQSDIEEQKNGEVTEK